MIPVETLTKTQQFLNQMGWKYRPSGNGDNVVVEICPFAECAAREKMYIAVGGEQDGLWKCQRCDRSGNLYTLKSELGIKTENATSIKDVANSNEPVKPLPDLMRMHQALVNDEKFGDVLEYLLCERKFSMEVIERLKLGAAQFASKKEATLGQPVTCYVIPYLDAAGNPVNYKARAVPPAAKEFFSPPGREARLYNDSCLVKDMDELIMVEGEADAIALLSAGYDTVVGIPGCKVEKASWIDKLDRLSIKNIYILYDRDKDGQNGAREMAGRIGIDKVKNIVLPEFQTVDSKEGKDVNEWLAAGHTIDELRQLMAEARLFNVSGVVSVAEAVDELRQDILGRGLEPKYKSPWAELNPLIGGFEDGDLVGVMAEAKVGKTTLLMNWLDYLSEQGQGPTFLDCLEMPVKRMVRKWVSYKTKTPDSAAGSQITTETLDQALMLGRLMKSDMLFGYHKTNKSKDILETIYQVKRRYGIKVLGFDNLQLLVRSLEHSAQETSRITKDFKQLAMELNILIFLIIQPKKLAEGQIVGANDGSGSGAISKDVDSMICLHRKRVLSDMRDRDFRSPIQTDETFEPQMLVKVDLSRYSAGGSTTLYMDGETSTVRSMTADDFTAPSPINRVGAIPVEQTVEA
jgi:5S rRNA maturation endonuclease (ribonuclease M5)